MTRRGRHSLPVAAALALVAVAPPAQPGAAVRRRPAATTRRAGSPRAPVLHDSDLQLGHRLWARSNTPTPAGGATLVLARSPWSSSHAVLAIHAEDARGTLNRALALTRAAAVGQISGSAMTVAPALGIVSSRAGSPPGQPPLALASVIDRSFWSRIPPRVIPAAVILVALLALGAVVLRRRWGWPKR